MLKTPGRYTWDTASRRYRDAVSGQFVSAHAIRFALDDTITATIASMRKEAERLTDRETTIAEWQRRQRDAIRDAHMWSAAAALGGWDHMTPADFGRAGARIKKQYAYLTRFASQLESGETPLDGRVPVRAGMYANAARATYEETRRRAERDGGMDQERRVTHSMEGCSECAALTAMGWQPIGTLPPLGEQICRGGCLCTFEYRKAPSISL